MHPGTQILLSGLVFASGITLLIYDAAMHKSYDVTTKCVSSQPPSAMVSIFWLSIVTHMTMTMSGCFMLVVSLLESAEYMSRCLEEKAPIFYDSERLIFTSICSAMITIFVNTIMAFVAVILFFVDVKDQRECLSLPSIQWYFLSMGPGLIVVAVPAVGLLMLPIVACVGFVYLVVVNIIRFTILTFRLVTGSATNHTQHKKNC